MIQSNYFNVVYVEDEKQLVEAGSQLITMWRKQEVDVNQQEESNASICLTTELLTSIKFKHLKNKE